MANFVLDLSPSESDGLRSVDKLWAMSLPLFADEARLKQGGSGGAARPPSLNIPEVYSQRGRLKSIPTDRPTEKKRRGVRGGLAKCFEIFLTCLGSRAGIMRYVF